MGTTGKMADGMERIKCRRPGKSATRCGSRFKEVASCLSESALFAASLSIDVRNTRNRKGVIKEEAIATCTPRQWSAFLEILALSSVTGQSIFTVYPSVYINGIRKLLHGEVSPRKRHTLGIMYIMWSTLDPAACLSAFQPNHFVPLRREPEDNSDFHLDENFPPLLQWTKSSRAEDEGSVSEEIELVKDEGNSGMDAETLEDRRKVGKEMERTEDGRNSGMDTGMAENRGKYRKETERTEDGGNGGEKMELESENTWNDGKETETSEDGQNDGQEMSTATGRTKKECPVQSCRKKVVHIPRHLQNFDKWNEAYARAAVVKFNLRKKYDFTTEASAKSGNRKRKRIDNETAAPKPKPCRRKRKCPLSGCAAQTERLPQHKLKRNEILYRRAISTALYVPTNEQRRATFEHNEESIESPSESELYFEDDKADLHNPASNPAVVQTIDNEADIQDDKKEEKLNSATTVMTQFRDWLLSPDGGRKDPKTVKQHVSQLQNILSVVDPDHKLSSLVDAKLIRKVFLGEYAAKYCATTVKSYLMSIQHYCSFLLSDQPQGVKFNKDGVVAGFERNLRDGPVHTRAKTQSLGGKKWSESEDVSALITPEKVKQFEDSQAARNAIFCLGQLCGAHNIEITLALYTLVRDYLLTQIMFDNANRAGVVAYMTVQEFTRAKVHDDRYVVRVLRHKTVNTHGPAQLIFTKALHRHMQVFMKEMRAHLPGVQSDETQPVFLSWSGNNMESSQMTKAVGSIFKKAGIDVHHTLYRKSAVSRCHDKHKEMASNLADLMAHREDTAQKYYRVFEKSKSSVRASQKLHDIMRNHWQVKECSDPEMDATTLHDADKNDSSPLDNAASPSANRAAWNTESLQAIRSVFEEKIAAKSISIGIVREKIKTHPCLNKKSPKRVYDRVRADWRYRNSETNTETTPVDLPKEVETVNDRVDRMFKTRQDIDQSSCSSDMIPPTTVKSSSSKGVFSECAVKTLLRLCKDMTNTTPISKPTIIARLGNDDEGKVLLKSVNINQLVSRLKYERKQRREKQQAELG